MSYQLDETKIEWTPVEEIQRMLTEQARPRHEQERLRAEQEAIEAERQAELSVAKGTMAYSEAIAIEICERISAGELLINICKDEHLPTVRRCTQWLNEIMEFKVLYDASISDRLSIFEEQVIQIADDASHDFKDITRHGRTIRVPDGEAIARAKLRVEVRFRHLKAYRPQRWGDVSTLNVKNEDANDPKNMSLEELEKVIADIENKSRIVKAA